jgi:hypothetical protein
MADRRLWIVAPAVVVVLLSYALHTYEERQAYKTGIYIGKAAFRAESFKRRNDLNNDSVMESALASANIIPSLSDSRTLHDGFRDGWREARTVALANR